MQILSWLLQHSSWELVSGSRISGELLQNKMTERQDKKSKLSDTGYREEKLRFCYTCLLPKQGNRPTVVTLQ